MLSNSRKSTPGRPFLPGVSGNPGGRPKGSGVGDLRRAILRALGQKRDGKRAADLLIERILGRALAGDIRAAKLLIEYAYGKPVTVLDIIERAGPEARTMRDDLESQPESEPTPPPAGANVRLPTE